MSALAVAPPDRGSPFQREHERTQERRLESGRMPTTLHGFLLWYRQALEAEMPERLHSSTGWVGRQQHDRKTGQPLVKPEWVGGSVLGSPGTSGDFRAYLEGSPNATEEEGTEEWYRFPLRSAMDRLRRKQPLMAAYLVKLAAAGFDWQAIRPHVVFAETPELAQHRAEVYTEQALRCLWERYRDAPPPRRVGAPR